MGDMQEKTEKWKGEEPAPFRVTAALLEEIRSVAGVNVAACFQCMKCSAGCPMTFAMDLLPHQVVRAAQVGMREAILGSNTPWICASCYTCSVRCPNDVDIARVMDHFRQVSRDRKLRKREKDVRSFHRSFLKSIRRHGRVSELGMIAGYKMRSGHLFKDMGLGWKMFRKGKLRILPGNIRGRKEVRDIFRRAEKAGEGEERA